MERVFKIGAAKAEDEMLLSYQAGCWLEATTLKLVLLKLNASRVFEERLKALRCSDGCEERR